MKKLLLLLLLTSAGPWAWGQAFRGKAIVGINGSQISGDGVGGFNQPGLLIGAGAEFPVGDRTTLEPEIFYSMKGSRTTESQADTLGIFFIYRLNYIELPLLLNYRVRDDFFVSFGPSAAFLFSARVDDGFGFEDVRPDFRPFDFQGNVALEYRFFDAIGFNMRLSHSLTSMNRIPVNDLGARAAAYNFSLSFTVRYIFRSGQNL